MDITTFGIPFVSCLLGLGVGYWLLRWGRRELAALAAERHSHLKLRLRLWGRRLNALAVFCGGVGILFYSAAALLSLLTRP